uniref:Uncharacterized protein n=1 Tax=Arundo donax TaxID=35708 RepID=A0A0A9FM68_ARUDO
MINLQKTVSESPKQHHHKNPMQLLCGLEA